MSSAPKLVPSKAATKVMRDARTGRLLVDGKDERQLVNQHAAIAVKAAPGKPRHLSRGEIRDGVKRMKVA